MTRQEQIAKLRGIVEAFKRSRRHAVFTFGEAGKPAREKLDYDILLIDIDGHIGIVEGWLENMTAAEARLDNDDYSRIIQQGRELAGRISTWLQHMYDEYEAGFGWEDLVDNLDETLTEVGSAVVSGIDLGSKILIGATAAVIGGLVVYYITR